MTDPIHLNMWQTIEGVPADRYVYGAFSIQTPPGERWVCLRGDGRGVDDG